MAGPGQSPTSPQPIPKSTEPRISLVSISREGGGIADAGVFFLGRIRTPWAEPSDCPKGGDREAGDSVGEAGRVRRGAVRGGEGPSDTGHRAAAGRLVGVEQAVVVLVEAEVLPLPDLVDLVENEDARLTTGSDRVEDLDDGGILYTHPANDLGARRASQKQMQSWRLTGAPGPGHPV